ncbi:MAG: carbon-nitrogen hydrolase family protein [Acidobacteria bacterium]|nr:carbon-nitrogen hydrolase family protein [Acidobacteriota bacterium]
MLPCVRVAAVAVDSKPDRLEANLAGLDHWAGRAAAEGAQLALFPELSVTGFLPNHPAGDHQAWLREALHLARCSAQSVPGPATEALQRIARAHNLWIAAGLLENAGSLLHNTHVLIGPDGLAGRWRKMHVPMFEMPFYNGGGPPEVAVTPLGRIGVNICFDALMPESTRLLATAGAEIVLFPFAADPPPGTAAAWANWAEAALRCRCSENGVFGVACNYTGRVEACGVKQQFPGGGMILGPRGEFLSRWTGDDGQPAMILGDLASSMLEAARSEPEYLFRFRRPELYGGLLK